MIGTLTLHKANNYGAVLQAYALQKYLQNLGHKSEIINYHANAGISTIHRNFIRRTIKFLIKPKAYYYSRIRSHAFEEFRQSNMSISSKIFLGDEQITKNPPKYDLYIAGSDQIWNTDITNKSKAFFLDFVKSGRKITYAASLGKNEFNETEMEFIKSSLYSIDAISVREKSLQQKLHNEFSIKARHVLDPVFLLDKDDWLKVSKRTRLPSKYVLCYMMEYSQELINHTKDVAMQFDCKPLFISPSHANIKGKIMKNLGPAEFIYTLVNARYICTNSFHGTAFSLIFQKDFTVVKHTRLNSRIASLIESVELNERFLDNGRHSISEIDYKAVTRKLEMNIELSQNFLKTQCALIKEIKHEPH